MRSPPRISQANGGVVSLRLCAGPAYAGRVYLILGSLFGNGPTPLGGGVILPLTIDPFTELVLAMTGSQTAFVGFLGALDAQGGANAQLVALPGQIPPEVPFFFPGMHFAWITVLPQIDFASNAVFVAFEL